jgi:signal transduction histidine kinase
LEQPTILIVSDDAGFAHVLKKRWQSEAQVPAFTLLSSDLCRDLDRDAFVVAVVGPVRPDALPLVLNALDPKEKSVLVVCEDAAQVQRVRELRSAARPLVQHQGWPDVLVTIASEIVLREEATVSLRQLEQANQSLERQAALGSYMLETRHSLNNALTSILGNAELLLLDVQPLAPQQRAQMETMRNMAVRIHEILARFTSIDKELSAIERPFENLNGAARSQAAGSLHH